MSSARSRSATRSQSQSRARSSSRPRRTAALESAPSVQGNNEKSFEGGVALKPVPRLPKNLNLPASAVAVRYIGNDAMYKQMKELSTRPPQYNTTGREVVVRVNAWAVKQFPTKTVYQYDVTIGNGNEKRGLMRKIWNSRSLQQSLGTSWLYDGNKIAWSDKSRTGVHTVKVDLDAEQGREPSKNGNTFTVSVRQSRTINLATLSEYLSGRSDFTETMLEAINFLDQLITCEPAKNMLNIKRNFYFLTNENTKRTEADNKRLYVNLENGVEALAGIYQSVRMAHGAKLVVNVDVANTSFWRAVPLIEITAFLANVNGLDNVAAAAMRIDIKVNEVMRNLRRLKRVRFKVKYKNMADHMKDKVFTVGNVLQQSADNTIITIKDEEKGTETKMSVTKYFATKYRVRLEWPNLPVVETTKAGTYFPMEVMHIEPGQRYPFKLSDRQMDHMREFAVKPPPNRLADIQYGLERLAWDKDPMLSHYGMKISPDPIKTTARLLQPPDVMYGNGIERPGTSGRWRFASKKFVTTATEPAKNIGVCSITARNRQPLAKQALDSFMAKFVELYRAANGNMNAQFVACQYPIGDAAEAAAFLHSKMETQFGKNFEPHLMIFILPDKETAYYQRLKKSADCRYGVPSQCMQASQVERKQDQYICNVLLKLHSKLGGQAVQAKPGRLLSNNFKECPWAEKPPMIIGADVSHAAPGSLQSSMAAVTMSIDKACVRFLARCQVNGHRAEMIQDWNWDDMLSPMVKRWHDTVGGRRMPRHVIYIRDGVSEGQFQQVMNIEVEGMRRMFTKMSPSEGPKVKFTVIIASKRHHYRFFPEKDSGAADQNGNALPGVLVEKDITSPRDFDFFLCSHKALKGTARPTHYHVLMDEEKMGATRIQNMLYEMCYQYVRATTPVSIVPAVYYAHVVSKRAASHIRFPINPFPQSEIEERDRLLELQRLGDETGKKLSPDYLMRLKYLTHEEFPPLIPLGRNLGNVMWYI